MPFGAPFQTVPKSACRLVFRPMPAIRLSEFGSTGCDEMSAFQGLSAGNTCLPAREAPAPVAELPGPAGVPGVAAKLEWELPPPPHPAMNRPNIAATPII